MLMSMRKAPLVLQDGLSELGLYRGQVGTIVEKYEPGVFEVEFSDMHDRAYALETLPAEQLMVLHHQPIDNKVLA